MTKRPLTFAKAAPRKEAFLEALSACGELVSAAKIAQVNIGTVRSWRARDSSFSEMVIATLALWIGVGNEKKCCGCLTTKPLTAFAKRSDRGVQFRTCVECQRVRQKSRYEKHKRLSFFKHKSTRAHARSRQKHLACNLTPEYLESIWTGVCPVFGVTLSIYTDRSDEKAAELDRLIPSLGYVAGNVAWLSRRANRLKNNTSVSDLEALLGWLKPRLQELVA